MILLTGATGYIGQKLLSELLGLNKKIIIPIRSKNDLSALDRIKSLNVDPSQLIVIECDLSDDFELFIDKNEIEIIVHNAAITSFNVDEETANKINRDGSRNVFLFASKCPNLQKIVYVSTVYASGMRSGDIKEEAFDNTAGFANHYERSKWEAEMLLVNEFQNLPWVVARVATIISEDQTGRVIQQNAVHNTFKLFFYGLISLLPGNANTPIYLVTGEFVSKALLEIVKSGKPHEFYHVCHSFDESMPLGQIIDSAHTAFLEDESFKNRRILRPLFTDLSSFEVLVDNIQTFGGAILSQGISSVAPFGKQLFIPKKVYNDNLLKVLGDSYPRLDMKEIVRESCKYLVSTKFSQKL